MSPQFIGTLLWIPFALVVLIAGLIYGIGGYKKGLWRALGSLGAVVISAVVSLLLAQLISGGLASAVAGMISLGDPAEIGTAALQVLLTGAVAMVVAMVLFIVLMLILTPVLCLVMGLVLGKQLIVDSKALKWVGMATGLVTAVVFALCLLSPVYGTLAMAVPVVRDAVATATDETDEAKQINGYVDVIDGHLLVKASGSGPVGLIYDQLSQITLAGNKVSLHEIANAADSVLVLVQQLQLAEDPATVSQISAQLVQQVRDNFVEQDWFYALSQDLVAQLKVAVAADTDMKDQAYVSDLLSLAEMNSADFRELMHSVLGFAQDALEKDVLTLVDNLSVTEIYQSGIIRDLGGVINGPDRLLEAKKRTMAMLLEEDGLTYAQAQALLDAYNVGELTAEKDQIREVESLLLPMLLPDAPAALMVLRHPSLGASALLDIREQVGFFKMMGLKEDTAKWPEDKQNALILALMGVSRLSLEELASFNSDLEDMAQTTPGTTVTPGTSTGNGQTGSKPGKTESQKKDKIKDMIESVGISGAKEMLESMDEKEQEEIKQTLDKMGVDSVSDAKQMVDNMEVEEIVEVMESMGFGGLVDKMGLKDEEEITPEDLENLKPEDLENMSKEELDKLVQENAGNVSKEDLDKIAQGDLSNLSKEDLLNLMGKVS